MLQHWSKLVTALLFLGCLAGIGWAIKLKHLGFAVTMVAMAAIIGVMVVRDIKVLLKK